MLFNTFAGLILWLKRLKFSTKDDIKAIKKGEELYAEYSKDEKKVAISELRQAIDRKEQTIHDVREENNLLLRMQLQQSQAVSSIC